MKIQFEEDFIYLISGQEAKIILRNCKNSCPFCPAVNLKEFYNNTLLNSSFDSSVKKLIIYGSANSPYVETFLKKSKAKNPKLEIELVCCDCAIDVSNLDITYRQVIHPSIFEYLKLLPIEFLIPATGDPSMMSAFVLRYRKRFPKIPIKLYVPDAGDSSADFWSPDKIEEFQKTIDSDCSRI
jgi:hypothetical protein